MAVNWPFVRMMHDWGMLRPGTRVLDIGSSNLYNVPPDEAAAVLAHHNPRTPAAEVRRVAERLAAGSGVDANKVVINGTWVGQFFEAVGMGYHAFDVAAMYKTEIFDLNYQKLPDRHRGRYDLVLNFGTTEHVVNQFNSFEVIHDAAKPGGLVWHQLPYGGYVDHCYFSYHPRFFLDLAGANGYDVVRYWVSIGGSSLAFDGLSLYEGQYPAVSDFLHKWDTRPQPAECVRVPDLGVNVIYRKTGDRPFRPSLEVSTAAGELPESVTRAYTGVRPPGRRLAGAVRRALGRVARPILGALRGR